MRARGVQFTGPRAVEVVDVEVPEPQRGQVLVRTEWSGISGGTELLAYRGEIDPAFPLDETIGALGGTFRFPFRYGYSCVGTVELSESSFLAEGERVFAFHPHQDAFVVDDDQVVVPLHVDPRIATLLPLVETALQSGRDAGSVLEEIVVVTGLGAVGILVGAMLQRAGARVVGSDPIASRRDAAKQFGMETASPEELRDWVGDGVPLVVEASGRPEVLADSLSLLSHEGTALVVSWYGTKPVSLLLGAEFHRRRLTIRSTQVSSIPSDQRPAWTPEHRRLRAAELLTELPVHVLATHEFPFERATDAFDALDRGEEGLLHAALRYG